MADDSEVSVVADAVAPVMVPEKALTRAQEGSRRMLESRLSVEQREALRKISAGREEKRKVSGAEKAERTEKTDRTDKSEKTDRTDKAEKAEKAEEAEVHRFGEDEPEVAEVVAGEAEPEVLTEDEVAALDEKARKIYREAQKTAAAVRKRAQEAEGKLKEVSQAQEKAAEEAAALRGQLEGLQGRLSALAGNVFAGFTEAAAVSAWEESYRDALAVVKAHAKSVAAGLARDDEGVEHEWPDGQKSTLTGEARGWLEQRLTQAKEWFSETEKLKVAQEAAQKLVGRYSGYKGYKEAHEALTKDGDVRARLPELLAKAAYFDMLNARKATVTFSDGVSGTKNPLSDTRGAKTQGEPPKRPPSEGRATMPRVARDEGGGAEEVRARKSLLMEKARTASTSKERAGYIREAILLGNPKVLERRASA